MRTIGLIFNIFDISTKLFIKVVSDSLQILRALGELNGIAIKFVHTNINQDEYQNQLLGILVKLKENNDMIGLIGGRSYIIS